MYAGVRGLGKEEMAVVKKGEMPGSAHRLRDELVIKTLLQIPIAEFWIRSRIDNWIWERGRR